MTLARALLPLLSQGDDGNGGAGPRRRRSAADVSRPTCPQRVP